MRSDLHDEIGVEGGGDSFQQWDRGHDTARFQPGQGGLCHPGPGGELDLGQAEGQAALTHGLADQESPASFRIPLAVLLALSPRPGEFLIGGMLRGHLSSLPDLPAKVAGVRLAKIVRVLGEQASQEVDPAEVPVG